jgi:RNA polymerase primary sigma factor
MAAKKKTAKNNDSMLEIYFKQIRSFPFTTFEEELELSKQIQNGNKNALHKLVNSNLRLVIKIAKTYNRYDIPFMDVIQEGNLGLIHAAEKYDYRKNVRFCTYAGWWIRQFVSRFIDNKRRIVRLPLRKEETLRKIHGAYHTLSQTLMRQPGNSDIARELGIPVGEVDTAIKMSADTMPCEQFFREDENINIIDIHEDYTYSPERNLLKQFSQDGTNHILDNLKDREKSIINYRYQLNGCEKRTLREIGDKFDISYETVRQIEKEALTKIRKHHANELRECVYVGNASGA